MQQFTLLLLLLQSLTHLSNAEECVIDYRSRENMWEQKLAHDIKCGYDPFKSPTTNASELLQVQITLIVKQFKYISEDQEFSVGVWAFISWYDDTLTWDPESYAGINNVIVSNHQIWVPSIKQFNHLGDDYDHSYIYIPCTIQRSGNVNCIAGLLFYAKCGADLSNWPFDVQICELELGPDTRNQFKFQFGNHTRVLMPNLDGEVYITNFREKLNTDSEKQLTITFWLKRHTGGLSAIVIFPSFILSVLALSTLLIDARSDTRLLMTYFSLMCHLYFLSELAAEIPKHSKNIPRLLLYYRGSFIMTGLMIVVNYILKLICIKHIACPNCIILCNDFVSMKFKFLIWPRWQTKVDSNTSAFAKEWIYFANIMNAVWIVVSAIVYGSIYCVFMPHSMTHLKPS